MYRYPRLAIVRWDNHHRAAFHPPPPPPPTEGTPEDPAPATEDVQEHASLVPGDALQNSAHTKGAQVDPTLTPEDGPNPMLDKQGRVPDHYPTVLDEQGRVPDHLTARSIRDFVKRYLRNPDSLIQDTEHF